MNSEKFEALKRIFMNAAHGHVVDVIENTYLETGEEIIRDLERYEKVWDDAYKVVENDFMKFLEIDYSGGEKIDWTELRKWWESAWRGISSGATEVLTKNFGGV